MRFLNKVKVTIDNINAKLNRGTKIEICSIVVALILCIAVVVEYNNKQKETAGTHTKDTIVYPTNKYDQKKDTKVVEVKDNNDSLEIPTVTLSFKPKEKKDESS